jgi:RNA polymerase sigma-70 factor (ECF subfamily)
VASRDGLTRLTDNEEFARLYEAHSMRLVAFFARRTDDKQVALDLTGETFANAFLSRRRFRGTSEEQALGWLFAIATRQLSSYWRRGYAERRAVMRVGVEIRGVDDEESARIIELAGLAELRAALEAELARLPRATQDALRLRVVEERNYHEVAQQLGTTETAVRARVSRGLRALAAALDMSKLADATSC